MTSRRVAPLTWSLLLLLHQACGDASPGAPISPAEGDAGESDTGARSDATPPEDAAPPEDVGTGDAKTDGTLDSGNEAGVDGGDAAAACLDNDGDGYGVGLGCLGLDCDDANPLIHPKMAELADDGLDNDCAAGDLKAASGAGYYVDQASASCSDVNVARGTKAIPYCTLEKAVLDAYQLAVPNDPVGRAIFVAKGTYNLVIGMPKSMRIFGGYDGATWSFSSANETVLGGGDVLEDSDSRSCRLGAGCGNGCVCIDWNAWLFVNTEANFVLKSFTIRGGKRPGKPLFAVQINSSGHVELADNVIQAGEGLQHVVVQIPDTAKDVWLIRNRIRGGTPSSTSGGNTVFGVNNLGTATLYGNVVEAGPGVLGSYVAAVQNYGTMRLVNNVLNPGVQGDKATSSYGLINLTTSNPPKPPTPGTAFAASNVIAGGSGVDSSRGVLSNSPLTLVGNVLVDRTTTAPLWATRPKIDAIPLDVGFASSTTLLHNVLYGRPYSDEPSPPNAAANRHLFAHSKAVTTYLETASAVNVCTWTGCLASAGNLAVDPKFVDPASDFHLLAGSPLIGAGTNAMPYVSSGLPFLDIDGQPRPQGAWDIGLDELP